MFGEQQLRPVVGDYLDEPADALCDLVLGSVHDFAGDESPLRRHHPDRCPSRSLTPSLRRRSLLIRTTR